MVWMAYLLRPWLVLCVHPGLPVDPVLRDPDVAVGDVVLGERNQLSDDKKRNAPTENVGDFLVGEVEPISGYRFEPES